MEKQQILDFINTGYDFKDAERIKTRYDVSYGKYDAHEIRDLIKAKKPVLLKDRLVVGAFPDGQFIDQNENKFRIERTVDGIVLNEPLEIGQPEGGDMLVIPGKFDYQPDETFQIIADLQLGPVFLPPHSVIINFINPDSDEKKAKIVSDLDGANINIYSIADDYIGNIFHEMGHLIWRTRLGYGEKKAFKDLARGVRASAIYEYKWETKDAEEIFCTIYKWYLKSMYVNKSFFNILQHEEPQGLKILQDVFNRLQGDATVESIWEMKKSDILDYLSPKFDKVSGKYIRKKGMLDRIKGIELPGHVLNDVESVRDGVQYVSLSKALQVPVKKNLIDFDNFSPSFLSLRMEKASKYYGEYRAKPLYMDMGVLADFVAGYKEKFGRNAYKDDPFTINSFCQTEPNFFRELSVIRQGRELYEALKGKFNIVVLTTPMPDMPFCKIDKVEWLKEHFPEIKTVIFSDSKADYASSEQSILIDDMKHNLESWTEAGGTAFDFTKLSNEKILTEIDKIFNPKEKIKIEGETEKDPTPAQKDSGQYKKGKVVYKGLNIRIENPAGSIRFGFNQQGKKWVQRMKAHYGYIVNGEDGNDGDKIDCFINPDGSGSRVFVINQINPESGLFDEHKIMLGYSNIVAAERAYLENYQKGWTGLGSIVQSNTKKLREWLETGNHTEPFTGDK